MHFLHLQALVISALLATCYTANQETISADVVLSAVETKIDLTSHLVKVSSSVTVENGGKSAVRSFVISLQPGAKNQLSFIGAVTKVEDEEATKLDVTPVSVAGGETGADFWRVTLDSSLAAGKTVTVNVDAVFSHALRPYPAEIVQSQDQLVQYDGNAYFYSPYAVKTQTTTVTLPSSKLESYSKAPKPVAQSEEVITYGPYENMAAYSRADIVIHYENNTPFLAVTNMERLVEVSHWGNIAVEETYDMRHTGATLKGSFSRYDYQRSQSGHSSIKSFKTILPAAAKDVYYRDEIGNISTSNLKELEEAVEVELRPRFPLYGGWKTHYLLGYNVPSYEYLFNKGDDYVLKMRFVDHVFDDQVIDDITLKVILPEGSRFVSLSVPYAVDQLPTEIHHTYLDTIGRPVIVAKKSNLVEGHIQDFELHYTYKRVMLLQEPLLVVASFYLLFMLVIIYVRLDFSITKDVAAESKMRVAGLVEQVQSTHDKRSALYQSYEDAVNKFKASKDHTALSNQRKKVDADYKSLTQQIAALQAKLKIENSEPADKVAELQRLDAQYKEQIVVAITLAEKLVSGKITKPVYLESEAGCSSKKEEIQSKMDMLLNTM